MGELEEVFVQLDNRIRTVFEKIYRIERRLKKIEEDLSLIKKRLRVG